MQQFFSTFFAFTSNRMHKYPWKYSSNLVAIWKKHLFAMPDSSYKKYYNYIDWLQRNASQTFFSHTKEQICYFST